MSFYCNPDDTDAHLTGYIEKFNEDELLIAHISSHGCYDGFILKRVTDVYRMDYDGEYEKKIERLYKIKKQSHSTVSACSDCNKKILYTLLDFAKENEYVISLEFQDSYLSGVVNGYDYDKDIIYLSIIDNYGHEEGVSIIHTCNVVTVSVDTDDEQDLNHLRLSDIK